MSSTVKYILAIVIGILPLHVFMIVYRLTGQEAFSTMDMLVYPLLIGGANILLILGLNKYLLGKDISDFNSGKGSSGKDLLSGLLLTLVYFLLMAIEQVTLAAVLSRAEAPSEEVIQLMMDLVRDPLLLAIWLGPVVWIGVALFEEMARTFFFELSVAAYKKQQRAYHRHIFCGCCNGRYPFVPGHFRYSFGDPAGPGQWILLL